MTPLRAAVATPVATYATEHVTGRAPHVRMDTDLRAATRGMLTALAPCLAVGAYNAGYQANTAMAALGVAEATGWRGSLLALLGVGYDATSIPACVGHGLLYLLPLLAVSALTGAACEHVFARVRGRTLCTGGSVVVLLFTLALPATVPLWQAALGAAFGVVLGKEVFGGTGRYFLNPALTGVAFVYFTFPAAMRAQGVWTPVEGFADPTALALAAAGGLDAVEGAGITWWSTILGRVQGSLGETSALGALVGGAYLVLRRLVSWRVIAGAVLGLAATVILLPESDALPLSGVPWPWHLTLGSFAFGAVFFATDPTSSPTTNAGRWVYGVLIGFVVVLIRVASPVHTEGVMPAILLGNVFAPLIDHGVVWANVRRRRRRA